MGTKKYPKEVAVYALTRQGIMLGQRIAAGLKADLFAPQNRCRELLAEMEARPDLTALLSPFLSNPLPVPRPFTSLMDQVEDNFSRYKLHVFIAAAGIVVRSVAPLIVSKGSDPAVLVIDQQGKYVISLLSGHLGGANAYALSLAKAMGATPIITTGTDTQGIVAIDVLAQKNKLSIYNLSALKYIHGAMLNNDPVIVDDPDDWLGLKNLPECGKIFVTDGSPASYERPSIKVSPHVMHLEPTSQLLLLHPPALYVGIGCRKGISGKALLDFVLGFFVEKKLSMNSVVCFASASIKQQEQGLLDLAKAFSRPIFFFKSEDLGKIELQNPSEKVREVLGVDGVCESAALIAARRSTGTTPTLLYGKEKNEEITIAIALGHGPEIGGEDDYDDFVG